MAKIDYKEWIVRVKKIMRALSRPTSVENAHWHALYTEGYSPFKAVSEMEYAGLLTWKEYRKEAGNNENSNMGAANALFRQI